MREEEEEGLGEEGWRERVCSGGGEGLKVELCVFSLPDHMLSLPPTPLVERKREALCDWQDVIIKIVWRAERPPPPSLGPSGWGSSGGGWGLLVGRAGGASASPQ